MTTCRAAAAAFGASLRTRREFAFDFGQRRDSEENRQAGLQMDSAVNPRRDSENRRIALRMD